MRSTRNFKEMFKTLFGGGMGEMRLTDEENLSESGIDIVASPPGKKLQSVLLLSGGEKALTAMALLLAILPIHAQSLLHPGRGRRAARRAEHRAAHQSAARPCRADAVHRHHPQQADHGSRAVALWSDDAGARGFGALSSEIEDHGRSGT